jgi:hypothetical protein
VTIIHWEGTFSCFVFCILHQQVPFHACPETAGDEGFIAYVYLPIHAPDDSRWENAMLPNVLIQLIKNRISG